MKRADTWMPLFVGDYMRDTGDLTTIEHGAYMLLIMQAWTRDGILPVDDERLRAMTRMDHKEWKRSRDTIMGLFIKTEGGYRHKRIERELSNAKSNNEQRRSAGVASAAARALQRKVNEPSTSVAIPLERNGRPTPSPSPEESKPRERAAFANLSNVKTEPETKRQVCNGWYVDVTTERILEAARIDGVKRPVRTDAMIEWLNDDFEPDDIIAVVRKCAARQGYVPPDSLRWFDKPVRQGCAAKPIKRCAAAPTPPASLQSAPGSFNEVD
jgi:uncharacterized protein YdaU (DUF1376 family)